VGVDALGRVVAGPVAGARVLDDRDALGGDAAVADVGALGGLAPQGDGHVGVDGRAGALQPGGPLGVGDPAVAQRGVDDVGGQLAVGVLGPQGGSAVPGPLDDALGVLVGLDVEQLPVGEGPDPVGVEVQRQHALDHQVGAGVAAVVDVVVGDVGLRPEQGED